MSDLSLVESLRAERDAALAERDAARAELRLARVSCQVVKDFLDRLEDASYDPLDLVLKQIRQQVHMPLHRALDSVLGTKR